MRKLSIELDVWLAILLLALGSLVLFTSCGRRDEIGTQDPAYHSPLTKLEAEDGATKLAAYYGARVGNVVYTGSMHPVLGGNCFTVSIYAWDKVKVGQIIVYQIGDKNVCHQVTEITGNGLRTKGINNPKVDPYYVTESMYLGTVVGWTFHNEP